MSQPGFLLDVEPAKLFPSVERLRQSPAVECKQDEERVFRPARVVFAPKNEQQLQECCDSSAVLVVDLQDGDVTCRLSIGQIPVEKFKFYFFDWRYSANTS